MSRENMDVVRAAYEAFERRDLEAVSRLHDPSIEWNTSVEDPTPPVIVVRPPLGATSRAIWRPCPGLQADLEECVEAPGDRVLATTHYPGRARASGMDMDWRQWLLYTVDEGLIVRVDEYFDREQALEAAGLSA
jgi:ketosteroid isomerase-like protein